MRQHYQRGGFTLVELLTVIAIIGILVALILPAVQSARESARRTECVSKMRDVALAVLSFQNDKTRYPGYVEGQTVSAAAVNPVPRPCLYMLLPHLDRKDVFAAYRQQPAAGLTSPPEFPYLGALVCPSNPESNGTPTHFVFNTGTPDQFSSGLWMEPHGSTANGVFNYMPRTTGQLLNPTGVKDGISTTLALSENIQAGNWTDVEEHLVGFVWHDLYDDKDPDMVRMRINGDVDSGGSVATDSAWARPSSRHAGLVNVAFLDGRTRSLSENIAYAVYAQLMTPDGVRASGFAIGKYLHTLPLDAADY